MALHHSKVHPDADARACAKWYESIAGKPFFSFRGETLGIKFLRFQEVFLSTMQGIWSIKHNHILGDMVAINLDRSQCTPGQQVCRRIESHCFLKNLQAVGQTGLVIIGGRSTLQDTIDFLLYLLIHLRMLAERSEEHTSELQSRGHI